MEQGKRRFAFIGCGEIAYYHADVILAHGHQIVGVSARPNSKKIGPFSQKYHIESCYVDFLKMLEDLEPDAIIVCTSWDQTEEICTDVIKSGIPSSLILYILNP